MNTSNNTVENAIDFLSKRNPFSDDLAQIDWICLLLDFAEKKGEDGIKGLAGFYLWCIENLGEDKRLKTAQDQERAIKSTFAHDLNGRDDEGMLPRSDGYIIYWDQFCNPELKEA